MHIDNGIEDPAGPVRMTVAPEKLLRLKQGLEEERDRLRDWLRRDSRDLTSVDPPGSDPCSKDTMFWMSQNGHEAVAAVNAYLDRLTSVIDNLHDNAVSYGLVEDDNTNLLPQGLT